MNSIYDNKENDNPGCLQGAVLIIGGFLAFAGIGWVLFRIIESAGKYIIILFGIIVAIIVVVRLYNLDKK